VRVLPPSPVSTVSSHGGIQLPAEPLSAQALVGSTSYPQPAWKEQVTFDWQRVDPELLQHCRTTNPVLHKNQYWV